MYRQGEVFFKMPQVSRKLFAAPLNTCAERQTSCLMTPTLQRNPQTARQTQVRRNSRISAFSKSRKSSPAFAHKKSRLEPAKG